MMKHNRIFLIACWLCFVLIGQFLKFSIPVGEQSASLSCLAIALPLLACFLPARISLPIISGLWLTLHAFHPIPLTMGIPTLLAALSWRISKNSAGVNRLFHLALPAAAIIAFAFSSSGADAWPYTLYWLIPMACTFFKPSLFSRALQSTFMAHAAGSLIWAYFVPLSGAQWLALIPVVALERLLAAGVAMALVKTLSALEVSLPNMLLSLKKRTLSVES
ncbi:MAG: hypothetical protein SNF33_04920 [Candidatus Algichlamydia australiensis]|nr:hypothetical protein [Chlamydiales bacterium]